MDRNRFAKTSFSLALVGVLFIGSFALASDPAEGWVPPCPRNVCGSTSGWTFEYGCYYYERSTDCLFNCDKYTYTSGSFTTSCRTNCMPV